MITIENKKLHDLIVKKDELVSEGRAITVEMEKIEKKIKACEDKEKKITGNTPPDKDLKEEGERLVEIHNETIKKLEAIGKKIEAKKMEAIPETLIAEHKELIKEVEQMEKERNKLALKIQKIKDRVVPLVQTEVKPQLKEFDDIETAKAKDGKVYITTFNHLADWMKKFKRRQ